MDSYLIYLLEVVVCQTVFYLFFLYTLRNQAFFQPNRAYLLSSIFISFVIPLLRFGVWSKSSEINISDLDLLIFSTAQNSDVKNGIDVAEINVFHWSTLITRLIFVIYLIGVLYHMIRLSLGLKNVADYIHGDETANLKANNIIWTQEGPPFFSFWKYIFINKQKLVLNDQQLQQVILHEQVHVRQQHTADIIFIELVVALCWFNPFIYKIRNALIQIHEYIADSMVVMGNNNIDEYSQLILQLSTTNHSIPFTHQFSKISIKNRINMLNQSNANNMKALKFLFVIPIIAILLAVFSFSEKSVFDKTKSSGQGQNMEIGEIHWKGNTKYTVEKLNQVMDIRPGDVYKKEMIENQLNYNPEKTTISDLYMDQGFLYFSVYLKDTVINGKVDLIFEVYEGITATVDKIIIKGNEKVTTQKILDMMEIKKGDLFNRTKLIASQKNIAKSGYFDEENVNIYPIPHDDFKLVDIEFTVHEIIRN